MGKTASDFSLSPEQLTGLRNEAASAVAGCCQCAVRKDGQQAASGKIAQLRADGTTPNGQSDSKWTGEVIVNADRAKGNVYVITMMRVINKTADTTTYPGTRTLTDAVVNERSTKIPPAVRKAWNTRPYRLKITDDVCGERDFKVEFNVEMVSSGGHYEVDFVNVDGMGTQNDPLGIKSGRSYVLPPDRAKFNLGDSRSATDNSGASTLEPHEYGHMIGLKDEYHDEAANRGGCRYTFPDGSTEAVGANGELMGSMSHKSARPERYCITIAYTVISVLASNGINVTACEIH